MVSNKHVKLGPTSSSIVEVALSSRQAGEVVSVLLGMDHPTPLSRCRMIFTACGLTSIAVTRSPFS
jgi:hypothetical protein